MQKLPIGIQTFSEIVTKDYLYIDKTKEVYELIESGTKFYFLSRPRRFGKSLFIDTLHSLFEAKKELFEGLYIYDKWDFDVKYPVIKIWSGNLNSYKELEVILYQAGYLTIDEVYEEPFGGLSYKLKIPNNEVKISLNDFIIDHITQQSIEKLSFKKDIYLVGINFDEDDKNIVKFEWEKYDDI